MTAAWAKVHEELSTSAFYQRVKQRLPLWQRLQKGGMFLAVFQNFHGSDSCVFLTCDSAGADILVEFSRRRPGDARHASEPSHIEPARHAQLAHVQCGGQHPYACNGK